MKAGLIHFYSTENVGDAAILTAMRRLVGEDLTILDFDSKSKAQNCDALISVGGDIFNNARPHLLTRRLLQKFEQLRWAPDKTLLFGQSIPPSCRGIAFQTLAYHLRRIASVTVRDPSSCHRLRARGVSATLSVDSAFALEKDDADIVSANNLFDSSGLTPDQTAVFSIRNFGDMYPIDEREFRLKIVQAMDLLRQRGYQNAILLQADVDKNDTDLTLAKELKDSVPDLKILNPFQASTEPWRAALGVAALAGTVIGTRYHTNIFRMIAGRMPVGLAYSNKGDDLTERMGILGESAATFHPEEIAGMAEYAAQTLFDPKPLRLQVRADFEAALARIQFAKSRSPTEMCLHAAPAKHGASLL